MLFDYTAKNPEGVIQKGAVEAPGKPQAAELLHSHGLIVLSLDSQQVSFQIEKYLPFLNKVPRKEMLLFSRQLATLINAKVPIVQSLEILGEQVTNKQLKKIIGEIVEDVEGGKKFSESLEKHPKVFSGLYVNLVRTGELSGTLDKALLYLANQQEKDYDLVSKIRGALTYPIFIVSAIFIVGGLMFVFVLPQMISVLKEAGAELPLTTRILIFATEILQNYWFLFFFILIGSIFGFVFYIRSTGGRRVWDAAKLRLPIVGTLIRNIYMVRFSRNLATLVAGGIPIVKSLEAVSQIVGNVIYRDIIIEAAREVETGKTIAGVLQTSDQVPKIVTQMIRIGEQTGELDEILGKLADFYDKEVENTISTLTTLLEPIVMLLLGGAVAVMVAGILLPIYNLASVQ
jgi:type IV pilus assembly protein PilC